MAFVTIDENAEEDGRNVKDSYDGNECD